MASEIPLDLSRDSRLLDRLRGVSALWLDFHVDFDHLLLRLDDSAA